MQKESLGKNGIVDNALNWIKFLKVDKKLTSEDQECHTLLEYEYKLEHDIKNTFSSCMFHERAHY